MIWHFSRLFTCQTQLFLRSFHVFGRNIPSFLPIPPNLQQKNHHSEEPIKTQEQVIAITQASNIVKRIFSDLSCFIKAGISTQDIDDFVFDKCLQYKVYPSPLGYSGFPKSVCTSVNEVGCHGIPCASQLLTPGDLLSVDISVFTGQAHGDACRTYVIEAADDDAFLHTVNIEPCRYRANLEVAQYLRFASESCCSAGISVCRPGAAFLDIARSCSAKARQLGCRVVAGIRGHGIGRQLHGPPEIVHCFDESLPPMLVGPPELVMQPGHVFTVEPCIALASSGGEAFARPVILSDGWTVVTTDRVWTAQTEQTLAITSDAHVVLT